jgi:hypothetical protein
MVMLVPDRIQYAPRDGASYEAPLDVLVPALMRLRKCEDSMSTLVLIDSVPEMILPALAWAASGKRYIPPVAIKTLVKACGPAFLERCLGEERARTLLSRFPVSSSYAAL